MRRIYRLKRVSKWKKVTTTYILKAEVVEAKFEVDEGLVFFEAVHELAPDLSIQFVVREIKTHQRLVTREGLDHFLNARVLLTIMRQVVRLEVEELESRVLAQGHSEHFCRRQTQAVSFQLQLTKNLVGQEGSG